jgi:2-polyprenyl-6-methoxyphenol hydroxylase-like FAD-dependent oxidoreductase
MRGRDKAIVIGSGLAGLAAARVLSEQFDSVTILERDCHPGDPALRPGVPQGFQLHLLLARGRELLTELFPSLDDALAGAGCPEHDILEGWRLRFAAGNLPRSASGCRVRGASRLHLEHEVRRLTAALPNVAILENAEVTGLLPPAGGVSVRGVTLKAGRPEYGDVPDQIEASLVVDASGRNSKAPAWLEALGFQSPPTTRVNGHLSYSTRWYENVKLLESHPGGILIGSRAPAIPRAGGVMRVEGGRFISVLVNIGADPAPTGDDAYLSFARSLASPELHDALRDATPLGPARGYQRTDNLWRHYASLDRLPDGFVPLGDAVCAFNPFYAQGMTVAALEAVALGREVARGPKNLARRAQRRFRSIVGAAWQLATSEDYRWPITEGPPVSLSTRLGNAYMDHVVEVATENAQVACTFIQVIHMKRSAAALFMPHVLFPVLAHVLTRKGTAQSRAVSNVSTDGPAATD